MDRKDFREWLINKKGKNSKVASDIISRLTRVSRLTNTFDFNSITLDTLNTIPEFKNMSSSLRSALKRSVELAIEYQTRVE